MTENYVKRQKEPSTNLLYALDPHHFSAEITTDSQYSENWNGF